MQSWFAQTQEAASGELQQVIDTSKNLGQLHNQATEETCKTLAREYLQFAVEHLSDIYERLIPNGLENGQSRLTYETLKEWQEQVASVQGNVFIIYLYWCGYTIHRYDLGEQ